MNLQKFDELYNKIILEAKSKSKSKPKTKFKKDDKVFVSINKKPVQGKIIKVNHDKELGITYDIDINLPDGPKTFLEKDVSDSNTFERPKNKRKDKDLLKGNSSDESLNEEGECCGDCGSAGLTSNAVFGPPGNYDSIVQPKEKSSGDPGLTTSDISNLYTPHKGTQCLGVYRRFGKGKRKRK